MKKIFLFAAAAALLTACSNDELSNTEIAQQNNAETPVAFSIYTPRNVTRAGAPGTITTASLKTGVHSAYGFGVFGYYTDGGHYSDSSTPNFMYNQKVLWNAGESAWKYEPVKYWPNEYGNTAMADEIDRVSFFAYAPWTAVAPTTGIPTNGGAGVNVDEKNITAMTKNTATGDPIIKYVVDTDPNTSVDLLWGVYAGDNDYTTNWGTTEASVTVHNGMPFIDMLKPRHPQTSAYTDADWNTINNDPGNGQYNGTEGDNKIRFNLRHALAKLFVTIDYIDDAATPGGTSKVINADETRIYVRWIKIGGFMMKGALNLNNTVANKPNWKAYDGTSNLEYEETIFKDGRKDASEGTPDGEASSEKYLGLNPRIIQSAPYVTKLVAATKQTIFDDAATDVTPGVTSTPVNLFGTWDGTKWNYDPANDDVAKGCIYVIPMDKPIDVEICYDVETVNSKLSDKLSDKVTPGKSIENKIWKKSTEIWTSETKMEAGKFYVLKLHLGMTSVKVDATETEWVDAPNGTATLPANE